MKKIINEFLFSLFKKTAPHHSLESSREGSEDIPISENAIHNSVAESTEGAPKPSNPQELRNLLTEAAHALSTKDIELGILLTETCNEISKRLKSYFKRYLNYDPTSEEYDDFLQILYHLEIKEKTEEPDIHVDSDPFPVSSLFEKPAREYINDIYLSRVCSNLEYLLHVKPVILFPIEPIDTSIDCYVGHLLSEVGDPDKVVSLINAKIELLDKREAECNEKYINNEAFGDTANEIDLIKIYFPRLLYNLIEKKSIGTDRTYYPIILETVNKQKDNPKYTKIKHDNSTNENNYSMLDQDVLSKFYR